MSHVIAVLAGGLSHERDVSIRSGRRVADALRSAGADVAVLDVDARLLDALERLRPDCVIPMLHGATGEDGSLRDVLDSLAVPYVGAGPDACRTAFDKMIARSRVAEIGVAVAPAVALPHAVFRDLGARAVLSSLVARIGIPLVVKPTRGGSALGMSTVFDPEDLPAAMVGCFSYCETAMLESRIEGTEVAVGVIEDAAGRAHALPVVEIVADAGRYDYAARYTAGTTEFHVPARLTAEVTRRCAQVALATHHHLGLRHLSRADLIVRPSGEVVFLEVNVAPGFTETSLMPQAIEAEGLDLGRVLLTLVDRAVSSGATSDAA